MMAAGYLSLAVFLAVTLNHADRWLRAAGTAAVALGLAMISLSILLADLDGTLTARMNAPTPLTRLTPFILNIQALVAGAAVPFLVWAAWAQTRRVASAPPLRNGAARFGLLSRYAHWITATLMLCSLPMGLFLSVLPGGSPERATFLAAHETMGLTLVIVVALRIAVLLTTPAPGLPQALQPWERRAARTLHLLLYGLIVAFPASGLLMSAYQGADVWFYGWLLPQIVAPEAKTAALWAAIHGWLLPAVFYAAILAHVGAVLKHHFTDGRVHDVRRMIT